MEKLLDDGWSVNDIVKNTNISKSTVYNVINKLKTSARYDFKNLMQHDYLWRYQKALERYSKSIRQCNEEIDIVKSKYNAIEVQVKDAIENTSDKQVVAKSHLLGNLIGCQSSRTNELIKLVAQRDKANDMLIKTYNAGPVVNAIDEWVNKTTPAMGDLPRVQEFEKIDPVVKPAILAEGEIIPNINDSTQSILPTKLNSTTNKPSVEDIKTMKEMNDD